MATNQVISADSHFVEPPSMWAERIDKKFRERAPHTEKNLKGREGEFFVCENITPIQVAGFFGSGKSLRGIAGAFQTRLRRRPQERVGSGRAPQGAGPRRRECGGSLYFDGDAAIR